ncbi:MAG: acyl-CoA thioesterase [Bacteroidales bacterium]|nr:acyl-CoA thioesterase [Bacteroidales bacterium]MDY6395975.1 thioesterase family protein [Bacteroidales bacterium]
MKEYVFDFTHRVKYYETDKMGYVHNSNYFRFFEIGREEAMRNLGISYDEMEKRGVMMPLIEQYAHYHIPAVYDDNVIIRTYVKEVPTVKIHFEYKVLRMQEGKEILLCQGWNKLCFVDETTRKPMRCPIWLQEKLEKVLSE